MLVPWWQMQRLPENVQGSPFRFEGPVSPELLIDRNQELATLARRAGDRVGVRLAAPRRYGKTSLLIAHAAQLRETGGWRTAHVDLGRVSDLTDVARRIAAAYGPLDASWMRAHLGGLLSRCSTGYSIFPRPCMTATACPLSSCSTNSRTFSSRAKPSMASCDPGFSTTVTPRPTSTPAPNRR